MSYRRRAPWWRLMAPVAAAALLGQACATVGLAPTPEAAQAVLKARAVRYWEVRQAGDLVAMYAFEEPRRRERTPLTSYMRGRGATIIESYEIQEVRVQDQQPEGVVKLRVRYRGTHPKLAKLPARDMDLEQQWVLIDGEWYLKYQPFGPPAVPRRPGAAQPAPPEGAGSAMPSP